MAAQSVADAGVIERGPDFAVYQQVTTSLTADGQARFHTNRFTLLENGLNYQDENGAWQESRDLIEPFAEGAVARYGPNQAIFSPDLNASAVFDIRMGDGGRLPGGVRAIQLTDLATGRSVALGSVKKSAPGELLPPDRIVYRDAFDGLKADVVLVWRHNQFLQDVVLRQRPRLPEGWKPDEVRLEVVTEFAECPDPELRCQSVGGTGEEMLEDHTVVDFGGMAILKGHAFPVDGGDAWAFDGGMPTEAQTPVLKQFHELPDGRRFLVESVAWTEAEGQWANLALNAHPESATGEDAAPVEPVPAGTVEGDETSRLAATTISVQKAGAASSGAVDTPRRTWPAPRPASPERQPIELAQMPYKPEGYLVDFAFVTVSGSNPTVFQTGWTYYVKTSYYSGSSVTFQSGATIKFKNNAYLLLYGPVSFPSSGNEVVFTSRNDDQHGAVIRYVPNEDDSDGNPAAHQAAQAIWIYYVSISTTIQNARITWARKGIQYDLNPGGNQTHYLSGSWLAYCEIGIYANLQNATLVLSNVKECTLGTEIECGGGGTVYGAMATDPQCDVQSVAWVNDPDADTLVEDPYGDPNKNTQSECSFVLADNNRVVAAFWDTHLSAYGLGGESFQTLEFIRSTGWATSDDAGESFDDQGALPPVPIPAPAQPGDAWEGDAGDPVMARDTSNGYVYLLLNPSREAVSWKGFRLWRSTDNGATFTTICDDLFSGTDYIKGDKPIIAVNNFLNLSNSQYIYVAGRTEESVLVTYSSDYGASWEGHTLLFENTNAINSAQGADIAITDDGTVYVFYLVSTKPPTPSNRLEYRYKAPGETTWSIPVPVPAHGPSGTSLLLNCEQESGSGDNERHESALQGDFFKSNGWPRVAVSGQCVYVAFADLPQKDPPGGRNTDRGDIFVQQATIGEGSGNLSWLDEAVCVSQGGSGTDQWNPAIAVAGNTLFVGYYSRQDRPAQNDLIRAYGVKADISNGLTNATFDTFPISSTTFPPLFPGPHEPPVGAPPGATVFVPPCQPWGYDHVFTQNGVALDENGVYSACPPPWNAAHATGTTYQHFMADDYTWAAADASHFYFAWCDRSQSCSVPGGTRPDSNVRFARIKP
ncbi:MAG: exo-alpha-sialidase [Verrucomicrobiales bacterium]|nr:exo-alpha-sialidase [Verrucomicrobiales bacterium]